MDKIWFDESKKIYLADEKEIKRYHKFLDRHKNCKHTRTKIAISASGLGLDLFMLCHGCNKFKNIANSDKW